MAHVYRGNAVTVLKQHLGKMRRNVEADLAIILDL